MDEATYKAERKAIQKAILDYFHEGHVQSDGTLYEKVLHPEWKFYRRNQGQLQIVDRDEYISWYKPENLDPELEWETEFYSIDITENVAAVKIRIECQEKGFIDYFGMMKLDGQWWMMSKMSFPIHKK